MILLLVAAMGLLSGTTWLAMQQSVARDRVAHHHLTGGGLVLCLLAVVSVLVAAVENLP